MSLMETGTTEELSSSATDKLCQLSSTCLPFKHIPCISQLFPWGTKEGRHEQPTTNEHSIKNYYFFAIEENKALYTIK